ncbi:hypothetical protein [Streptomyces sp. NPDC051909]|uniref:hypothetical protein n=1 Tax=Streptomyces sp. NPDC051909 TaxID=3154944 RepID=UPI003427C29F
MPKKIDAALRSQTARLVTEHRAEYSSERALHIQVAEPLGVSRESVRRWGTAGSATVVRCQRRRRNPSIPNVRMILATRGSSCGLP